MKEILEIIRRRKIVFIIPFLIVFILPTFYSFFFMRTYEVDSLIWIDDDLAFSTATGDTERNDQGKPIDSHANVLTQLLGSRSFLAEVINKTDLQYRIASKADKEEMTKFLKSHVAASVTGPNSLSITYDGTDPKTSVQVVKAITDMYMKWALEILHKQQKNSVDFSKKQLSIRQKDLERNRGLLQVFKEQFPETKVMTQNNMYITPSDFTVSPQVQVEYERLSEAYEYSLKLYNTALDNYAKTSVMGEAEVRQFKEGFRVIDQPIAPLSFSKKKMLLTDAMAFAVAFMIGIIAIIASEVNDKVLRRERDIKNMFGLPSLVEIPYEKSKSSDASNIRGA